MVGNKLTFLIVSSFFIKKNKLMTREDQLRKAQELFEKNFGDKIGSVDDFLNFRKEQAKLEKKKYSKK